MIKILNPIPQNFFVYIAIILVCLSVFLAPNNESAKASIYQPKAELPSDVFFVSKNIESSSQNSQTSSQISSSSQKKIEDKTSNVLGEIKANAESQPEKVVVEKQTSVQKMLAKDKVNIINKFLIKNCPKVATGIDGNTFLELENKYKIDSYVIIAIAVADSSCGASLSTPFNLGNVGNTDSCSNCQAFSSWKQGVEAMFQTLTNKYLGASTKVCDLSRGGWTQCPDAPAKMKNKFYASSPVNWNRNVVNTLTVLTGEQQTSAYLVDIE